VITYQSLLKNELLQRQRKNPSYSLRSFARDLKVSQSFLSQVLSFKRKLGDEKAIIIADKLKFKSVQKRLFLSLIRRDLSKSSQSQEILNSEIVDLLKKSPKFAVLSEDTFNIVADWHYFAILELTAIKNFKSNVEWVARRLNIPVSVAQTAVERLLRVGLLESHNGCWRKVERDYIFENVPSHAIRRHHRQTLDLAHLALQQQRLSEREFFTISMPMDPKYVAKAKEAISEFSKKLMSEMQESEPKSVYKLAIQFFRLDKELP